MEKSCEKFEEREEENEKNVEYFHLFSIAKNKKRKGRNFEKHGTIGDAIMNSICHVTTCFVFPRNRGAR